MNSAIDTLNSSADAKLRSVTVQQYIHTDTSGDTPSLHGSLPRIVQLDGLRGLLALYVAIYHLATQLIRPGAALAILHPVLDQAWFSVDVFFVMSGFVMMHVYGRAFEQGLNHGGIGRFFVARIARLFPVHVFAMLVMALGVIPFIYQQPEFLDAHSRFSWQAALASLFMLHSPWIDHRTWNYPAWSISAEWHAYLIFPLLVPLLAKFAKRSCVVIVLIGVCIPLCVYLLGDPSADRYPTNGMVVLARVLPLFMAGMALQRLHMTYSAPGNVIAYATLAFMLCAFAVPPAASFAVLAIPLLIIASLSTPVLSRFFSNRTLVWLGTVSYSLYMTHALIEMFFVNAVLRWSARYFAIDLTQSAMASTALLLAAVGIALITGWTTWRWIEVPGRLMVNRLMNRSAVLAGQTVAPT